MGNRATQSSRPARRRPPTSPGSPPNVTPATAATREAGYVGGLVTPYSLFPIPYSPFPAVYAPPPALPLPRAALGRGGRAPARRGRGRRGVRRRRHRPLPEHEA